MVLLRQVGQSSLPLWASISHYFSVCLISIHLPFIHWFTSPRVWPPCWSPVRSWTSLWRPSSPFGSRGDATKRWSAKFRREELLRTKSLFCQNRSAWRLIWAHTWCVLSLFIQTRHKNGHKSHTTQMRMTSSLWWCVWVKVCSSCSFSGYIWRLSGAVPAVWLRQFVLLRLPPGCCPGGTEQHHRDLLWCLQDVSCVQATLLWSSCKHRCLAGETRLVFSVHFSLV